MAEKRMRDALIYAKLGMQAFGASYAIMVWILLLYPIFFMEVRSYDSVILGILVSSPSLILTWLTLKKIVKPLSIGNEPSKRWAMALEVLGYFFGYFFAGLLLYIANKKLELTTEGL